MNYDPVKQESPIEIDGKSIKPKTSEIFHAMAVGTLARYMPTPGISYMTYDSSSYERDKTQSYVYKSLAELYERLGD